MDELQGSTAEVDAPEAEEKSMDDTIRETLNSIKDRDAEAPEASPEVTGKADAPERPRDESGKFAAKSVPVEAPLAEGANLAAPIAVPPELQRLGLRKEAAEAFMQAPQVLRDEFMRRADEMGRGIEQYKQAAQFAQAMQAAIAPHMETLQSLGVSPDVAVGKLFEADATLRRGSPEQKQQMLAQIARDYGIQLEGLQSAPPIDPSMYAMQQQLRQIEQRFQTQEQQREQQSLNSQIAEFAADPNHSHFEKVRGHMGALIQAGHAQDLKSAYEQAVWANPETRAAMIAQQQEAARKEATQKAQAAKQAASVNVRTRPALPTATPIGSMDDTIRATLRRLQAA